MDGLLLAIHFGIDGCYLVLYDLLLLALMVLERARSWVSWPTLLSKSATLRSVSTSILSSERHVFSQSLILVWGQLGKLLGVQGAAAGAGLEFLQGSLCKQGSSESGTARLVGLARLCNVFSDAMMACLAGGCVVC